MNKIQYIVFVNNKKQVLTVKQNTNNGKWGFPKTDYQIVDYLNLNFSFDYPFELINTNNYDIAIIHQIGELNLKHETKIINGKSKKSGQYKDLRWKTFDQLSIGLERNSKCYDNTIKLVMNHQNDILL